jgi:hypothetical protein
MPALPVPYHTIVKTVKVWESVLDDGYPVHPGQPNQISALGETTSRLGLSSGSRGNVERRLNTAVALGLTVEGWPHAVEEGWVAEQRRRYEKYDAAYRTRKPARAARGRRASAGRRGEPAPVPQAPPDTPDIGSLVDRLVPALRRGPLTLEELAEKLGVGVSVVLEVTQEAEKRSLAVNYRSEKFHLDSGAPAMGHQRDEHASLEIVSDSSGVIRFAAIGDTHLCSKYARLDCLEDFYTQVERNGIKLVLHAGNWIDGEISFNRHDLLVHGMDQQMQYLAKHYPQRDGIETWAITGEDHEGWYSRREGVDVGRYAERVMRDNGRTDWRDVGFMENYIDLVHGGTGKRSKLLLMHPGGGSAYAVSYAPQKIVEGFDGGDKPAVLLLGHYHKSSYNLIRNVHTFQVGCFEDQTVFMRKQKIAAHLGGWDEVQLELDGETGAVIRGGGYFRNYFVRGYYEGRWSQHGPVNHAPRRAGR